jgi:hypothetical protein
MKERRKKTLLSEVFRLAEGDRIVVRPYVGEREMKREGDGG